MRRTVIALLLVVTGTAATAQPAPGNQPLPKAAPPKQVAPKQVAPKQVPAAQDGKCVGVVSAIGDTLKLVKVGFTVFNNEQSKVSIDSWGIDDLVFNKVSAVHGKRFNLKRVSVAKGAFGVIEEDHGPFYDPAEDITSVARKITTPTKCDRYIVVTKNNLSFKAGLRIDGLGILTERFQYSAYAPFTMNIYDGRNFALLAKHKASTGKNYLGFDSIPVQQVDESWWPAAPADAATSPKIRDGFRALVQKALDVTVPQLLND
jgi:hypothetical protein